MKAPAIARRLSRDAALGLIMLGLLLVITALFPRFAAPANLLAIMDDSAILILLALGQMLVMLTRAIDLSMASNLALCGMASALFNQSYPEAHLLPALGLALALGTVLGAINGVLVWRLRVPAIVVTLGTLSIYRGVVFLLSGGAWVNSSQMSAEFLNGVRGTWLGLTTLSWCALAGAALAALLLQRSGTGRDLYAAGDNPDAAAYAGIDVGRSQCFAFTLAGAIAGLCGYFWVARFGVAYTDVAQGFELQVIAACVIGGVAIAGGAGTVTGIVLGGLFLGVVKNALPLIGLSPFWQMAISGLVITIAVVINARARRSPGRVILRDATP